jgi:hypothetical protein
LIVRVGDVPDPALTPAADPEPPETVPVIVTLAEPVLKATPGPVVPPVTSPVMSIAPLPPGIKIAPPPVNPVTLPVTIRADAPGPKLTALPTPEVPRADDTDPVICRVPAV